MADSNSHLEATVIGSCTAPSGRADRFELSLLTLTLSVGIVGSVSLVLGWLSLWSLLTLSLTAGAILLIVGWIGIPLITTAPMPPLRWVLAITAVVALNVWLTMPGYRIAMAGQDPGVYTTLARSIVENGTIEPPNPAAALMSELPANTRVEFPAVFPRAENPDVLHFSFYHLYPALGAPAYAAGRSLGLSLVNPFLAILAVLGVMGLGRRIAGDYAGLVAGVVLSTSSIWIYFAKWTGSEPGAVSMWVVAALGAVVARSGNRFAAVSAGFIGGLAFAFRGDALIITGLGCAVLALAIADRQSWAKWMAVGAIPTVALSIYQAWGPLEFYTLDHHLPALAPALVLLASPFIGAGVILLARHRSRGEHLYREAKRILASPWLRVTIIVGSVLGLVFLWLRANRTEHPGDVPLAELGLYYQIQGIKRIVLVLGLPIALLIVVGLFRLVAKSPWWAIAALSPGLVGAPIFLYRSFIFPFLFWATRRWLTTMWPVFAILVGIAVVGLAVILLPRKLQQAAVGVATLLIGVGQLSSWWEFLDHEEWEGTFDFADSLDSILPEDSLILWTTGGRPPGSEETRNAFGAQAATWNGRPVVSVSTEDLAAVLEPMDKLAAVHDLQLIVVHDGDPGFVFATNPVLDGATVVGVVGGGYPAIRSTLEELPTGISNVVLEATVVLVPSPVLSVDESSVNDSSDQTTSSG